jgi:hypothetical protein
MGPDKNTPRKKPKPREKGITGTPSFYAKPGNAPRVAAPAMPAGRGGPVMDRTAGALGRQAGPMGGTGPATAAAAAEAPALVAPSAARGIPAGAPVAPRQAVAPSLASRGTVGLTNTISPRPAQPSPATAKGFREGLKIGSAKIAAKATKSPTTVLESSTKPKPRPKAEEKKSGLAGLLTGNKGNNQKLALERMKKASRKG